MYQWPARVEGSTNYCSVNTKVNIKTGTGSGLPAVWGMVTPGSGKLEAPTLKRRTKREAIRVNYSQVHAKQEDPKLWFDLCFLVDGTVEMPKTPSSWYE